MSLQVNYGIWVKTRPDSSIVFMIIAFLIYLSYLSLREMERFTPKEASILFVGMAIIFCDCSVSNSFILDVGNA